MTIRLPRLVHYVLLVGILSFPRTKSFCFPTPTGHTLLGHDNLNAPFLATTSTFTGRQIVGSTASGNLLYERAAPPAPRASRTRSRRAGRRVMEMKIWGMDDEDDWVFENQLERDGQAWVGGDEGRQAVWDKAKAKRRFQKRESSGLSLLTGFAVCDVGLV